MKNIFLPILFLILIGCSETKSPQNESYEAGFRTVQTVDSSRLYKPGTDITDYLHFRPLDIDIWYPSNVDEKDSTLLFRNILGLLEKRANYYTASNQWSGATRQIAQSFCDGYKCSDTTKLLNFRTRSVKNASSVNRKFPLIIYLCAYNGMSYENFTLFEELAKRGFVVASINSIGRFPGDMTMKKEDLFEQVKDAVVSFNTIKQNPDVDFSKVGIIGYSWGALAAVLVHENIPNVSCLISLDGSEFHHYGKNSEEDTDFNTIKDSPEFKNLNVQIPYLRLESSPSSESSPSDSIYNFSEKLRGKQLIFEIDSARHEDFSCLSAVVRESGDCIDNLPYNTILKLTLSFLEDHLKNTNSFSRTIEQEINKTIQKR